MNFAGDTRGPLTRLSRVIFRGFCRVPYLALTWPIRRREDPPLVLSCESLWVHTLV
jgi:hypothetical protein